MKFVQYRRAQTRGCKIDWDAPVEITADLRRALHPHDLDALHVGRLRRPFLVARTVPGRRTRHVVVKHPSPEPVPHDRGAIVFAYPDESVFFIEVAAHA